MSLRILAILTAICAFSYADTITLRDGRRVTGSFLGGDARQIRMVIGEKVQTFSIADIAALEFGNASTTAQAPPTPAPPPPPDPDRQVLRPHPDNDMARPDRAPDPDRQPRPRPDNDMPPPDRTSAQSRPEGSWEIPAGTQLVVSLIDPVDSERDRLGQTYRASLAEPLMGQNGDTLVPRGADVVAKLVADQQSGKIEGRTVLTLDLQSITIDGRPVDITTESVSQASSSRGARSGKVIGGTAALGAIIGAIAGGGKGAAVGAASGGAVGTGVQVATKGQRVRIPSETRLTFTLQQPLHP